VLNWRNDAELETQIRNSQFAVRNCFVVAHTKIPATLGAVNVSVIPHDAEAFARALYAELHRCDEAGAELIVVEAPPDSPEWSGIADRLRRAAA
jgi:L-threonylcarbamoyladenylate synthase